MVQYTVAVWWVLKVNLVIDFDYSLALAKSNNITDFIISSQKSVIPFLLIRIWVSLILFGGRGTYLGISYLFIKVIFVNWFRYGYKTHYSIAHPGVVSSLLPAQILLGTSDQVSNMTMCRKMGINVMRQILSHTHRPGHSNRYFF